MSGLTAFAYPTHPHARRHGPAGYDDYGSFRDWLRDEFCFRCVFCLQREQWVRRRGGFHLDHFTAQATRPELALEYDNLLYVCASCNTVKGKLATPDPCKAGFGKCLRVSQDGSIEPLSKDGELLIDLLRLDDPDSRRYRKLMIETLALLRNEPALFAEWMGFPEDLPDLADKRPPRNSRPDGVKHSYYELRLRGELPDIY